jgi:hypothetical protein
MPCSLIRLRTSCGVCAMNYSLFLVGLKSRVESEMVEVKTLSMKGREDREWRDKT